MNFPFYESAPKEQVSECNLCGAEDFLPMSLRDRYGLQIQVASCRHCGLTFLSERMTPEAYREFYEQGHYRRISSLTFDRIERSQRTYADRLSRTLAGLMGPYRSGLLLDVGGSTGIVADTMAHDYDLDATVLEPSAYEAQRARDKGLTVLQMPLEEYKPNGERYDVVLLCQSVDHLLDVKASLRLIRRAMRDHGLFFVDWVRLGQGFKIDHPFYLTRKTMARFLSETGFEPQLVFKGLDVRHMSIIAEAV